MGRCGCSDAASAIGTTDTASVDMSLINGIISAAVKRDPAAGNLLTETVNGLRVDCTAVAACVGGAAAVHVADSVGIDFTESGAGTVVDPRIISGDLKAVFAQTVGASFTHTLSGAVNVFEKITELADLAVPAAGNYWLGADVVGNATIPTAGAGVSWVASCSFYVAKNGVLIPNTETRLVLNSQGAATTAEPALQLHGTGSVGRVVSAAAGDLFSIWAARTSADAGTVHSVLSSTVGRTRIQLHRIGA